MAVSVEIHHTGSVPEVRAEIAAIIEHARSKALPASMSRMSSGSLWRGWCRGGTLERKFRPLLVVVLVSGADASALAGGVSVGGRALFPLSAFR